MVTICGLDTEYGIFCPQHDPEAASRLVVEAAEQFFTERGGRTTRWDHTALDLVQADLYAPQKVAAELDQTGQQAPIPSLDVVRLSAQEEKFQRRYNKAVSNGARFYVDHSHPEYATPEANSPLVLAAADLAGGRIVQSCAQLAQSEADGAQIQIFKHNQDGKGHAYGSHENYLVPRELDPERYAPLLIPFFLSRVLLAGSGRVGLGPRCETPGFQISQRADFIEQPVSLTTQVERGVINTRDEPHADPARWRRFHYIGGDANCFPYANWLKVALGAIALELVAQQPPELAKLAEYALADPAAASRQISRDLTGQVALELANGQYATPLEILQAWLQVAQESGGWDREAELALAEAQAICQSFAQNSQSDAPPLSLADRVEWIAKYQLFQGIRTQKQLAWDAEQLGYLDLQWGNQAPQRGLAQLLQQRGQVRSLDQFWAELPALEPYRAQGITDFNQLVSYFIDHPPLATRAWGRGQLIRHYDVPSANWHCVVLDGQDEYPQMLFLTDPQQWTRQTLGAKETDLIEQYPGTAQFLDRFALRPEAGSGPRYGNLSY